LRRAGERIRIEEDQRNTAVFEWRYDQLPKHFYAAFGGRHDSGYSVELDPDVTRADFENEFPQRFWIKSTSSAASSNHAQSSTLMRARNSL
jgi:hypothetical protein